MSEHSVSPPPAEGTREARCSVATGHSWNVVGEGAQPEANQPCDCRMLIWNNEMTRMVTGEDSSPNPLASPPGESREDAPSATLNGEPMEVTVFHQPELALEVMRAYATKCDQRHNGERRCKSCGFLLRACDEIELLRSALSSLRRERPKDVPSDDVQALIARMSTPEAQLAELLGFTASALRSAALGPDDDATLAEWFRVGYLREAADTLDKAKAVVGSLRREREEARKDSERLDWLNEHAESDIELTLGGYWYTPASGFEKDIRKAIDAASRRES